MGSGKRNYSAMRQQLRKKITKEGSVSEVELRAPDPENTKNVLEMWKKAREKKQNNSN